MTRTLRAAVVAGVLALAAPLLMATSAQAATSDAHHVTVPSSYVYNPNTTHQRTLHDYCTKSPDEYRTYGTNANFRGPCARHDLCIMHRTVKRSTCDSYLLSNMKSECRWTYSHSWDPRHAGCLTTAYEYWLVVRAKTAIS